MDSIWVRSLKQGGEHSYHRRAINHDYYAPFIYHIILKKTVSCESFGTVVGDARIAPGLPGSADIDESELGRIIAKAIIHLPYEYPIIMIHQYKVMPDHVHILLQVMYRSDKHLDFYIDSLRKRIAVKYSKIMGELGAILVSPFISKAEKDIRYEAEDLGSKIILIVHQAFSDRYKPAAHDFALCAAGHLLIISLCLPIGTKLTRSVCERMNELAKTIARL